MKSNSQYAYSLKVTRVQEKDFPYQNEILDNPESVHRFCSGMMDLDIEQFVVIYLDSRNAIVSIHVQPGTVDQTAIYPREVCKQAIMSGSTSVILAHNHPSGSLEASRADRDLTRRLNDCLMLFNVKIVDHLIICSDKYFSFSENNYL